MRQLLLALFVCMGLAATAQTDIIQIMERTDLRIDEVEQLANRYFEKTGTGRGTGYKQYQRWLYERKFHLDEQGYFINPRTEDARYKATRLKMRQQAAGRLTSQAWTELGPNSWTKTSGWNPGVGRITSVAVHPANESVIYVSSPGGGIWKSPNGGASWTPLIDFASSAWMNIFHLCIDPSSPGTLYAALASGGVIKSTNAGATWQATGSGPSNSRKVVVHPSNSNIVFATATNGLYRSVNGGTSWTRVQSDPKEDIEFNPADPNIVYASGSSGASCVWRSTDNGVSWTAIGIASGITNTGRTLLAVSPASPGVVYAVQANASLFGRLYKSTDAGLTYTTTVVGDATNGTNYFGYQPDGKGTTGQATYDMALCVNPLNAQEVYLAGINCWKSTDGGLSFGAVTDWTYPNPIGYIHADVHSLEWVNSTLYSSSDGGIYKSTNNGGDWTDLSRGLGIRQFYRIACAPTDPAVITGGAQDNGSTFRRTNGAWVEWLGADGMDNVISPTNANIAIGTSQGGEIYKTTNAGTSYTNLSKPSDGNWVTPLVMHPTNHDTVYGGWTGIYRSVNGGSSWTLLSASVNTGKITALAVAPSNTRYIYGSVGSILYRTSDGGATWTSVTAPAPINAIFVSPVNPQKIWLACNSTAVRVVVSSNMGTSFTDISAGLPSLVARSVVVDDNAEESMYVGMNIGVYYRDNTNTAWVEHGTGLPLVAINEVEIHKSSRKLRVATYGRGVWETDLSGSAVPACSAPAGLATASITTSSATVSWAAVSGANSYDVEYKTTAAANWTTAATATTATSVSLSALTPATVYQWRVRTNCTVGSSTYSPAQFTTETPVCPTVTSLNAAPVTHNTATLSWTAVSDAISYDVEIKPMGSGTWTTVASATTATSIGLAGLNVSTTYDWRVRANCPYSSSSYVSAQFTTLAPPCVAPVGLTISNLAENTATLSWAAVAYATGYSLEYKTSAATTWTSVPVANGTTSATLVWLIPATTYDWRVKAQCLGNSSSPYSTASFTTGVPTCPGPYDQNPNDSKGNEMAIPLDQDIRGTISSASDQDRYQFTLAAAGPITITLTNLPADYDLRLYHSNGTTLLARSQNNGTNSETIRYTVAAGSYYVLVSSFKKASNASSCYILKVTTGDVPPAAAPSDLYVKASPNPASSTLSLYIQGIRQQAEVRILDMKGRLVLQKQVSGTVSDINVSGLAPAVYLLQVNEGGRVQHLKFVKE